jgi:hypothetical protein
MMVCGEWDGENERIMPEATLSKGRTAA